MALTKKDLQEVVGESEKRLAQKIEGVRSDVKILETLINNRLDKTDRKIDNLTEQVSQAFKRTEERFEANEEQIELLKQPHVQ